MESKSEVTTHKNKWQNKKDKEDSESGGGTHFSRLDIDKTLKKDDPNSQCDWWASEKRRKERNGDAEITEGEKKERKEKKQQKVLDREGKRERYERIGSVKWREERAEKEGKGARDRAKDKGEKIC